MKIKSLAEEAKIIKKEEKRNPHHRQQLYLHRILNVRREQLASLIAYAFIRGKILYLMLGMVTYNKEVDWDRVLYLINKYGENEVYTLSHKERGLLLKSSQPVSSRLRGGETISNLLDWIKESYPSIVYSTVLLEQNKLLISRWY